MPSQSTSQSGLEVVRDYCEWLFKRAEMDSFDCWWTSGDPRLGNEPPESVVIRDSRRVIARAEDIAGGTS